jgi:TrmH RNA methyltransferase
VSVERIYGLRACLAVLEKRPKDVLRVACTRDHLAEAKRLAGGMEVGVLGEREIEKLAHSNQHEGIVLEARARKWVTPNELGVALVERRGVAIAFDRVRNSYNIGAVLRSAAFFGTDFAVLGAPLDANAVRVAEGGVEHLVMARTTDLADTLGRLKARGVAVIGTDGQAKLDAVRTTFRRPAVLVMGNEREGMGARVRAACDKLVAIRGSGAVESLNVAVAAGILLSRVTAAE